MKKSKWDNKYLGLLVGIIFSFLGFYVFFLYMKFTSNKIPMTFERYMLIFETFRMKVISFSIVFMAIPFFIALKNDYVEIAKGILITLVIGIIIASFYF